MVAAQLPVASLEGQRARHDAFLGTLGRTIERLAAKVIELLAKGLAHEPCLHVWTLRRVRDLQQHGAHIVHGLEQLNVDVPAAVTPIATVGLLVTPRGVQSSLFVAQSGQVAHTSTHAQKNLGN